MEGQDIGYALVWAGPALDDHGYSKGAYTGAKAEAYGVGPGIRAGTAVPPCEWRKGVR
jgi:hypothetical protein